MSDHGQITELLGAVQRGDPGSLDRLFELVYDELKHRAHFQLRGATPTLGTTALVHETYLKLASGSNLEWNDRLHFFRVAARAMRQIVIDRARSHLAAKRGGGAPMLDVDQLELGSHGPGRVIDVGLGPDTAAETLMALDEALSRLGEQSERLAQVVELRFFGGFSTNEAASALGVSDRTVKRDWRLARAFLQEALSPATRSKDES